MNSDQDDWPVAPRLLDDPGGFALAWLRRVVTVFLALRLGWLLLVALPFALLAYVETGEVSSRLIKGIGFLVIGVLIWLAVKTKGGSAK
jgi:hypothetical protein